MSVLGRALVAVLAVLATVPSMHAGAAPNGTRPGTVLLPGGHEYVALRMANEFPSMNGLIGYVIDMGFPGVANGTPVLLTETSPEPVELDVVFFERADGGLCRDNVTNDGVLDPFNRTESGTTSCDGGGRARYAVVVMVYGAAGSFRLTWG